NRSDFENLIGLFVNMLPLRGDLSGNPSFRELLARVRRMCLEALGHQDVPFEKIVEAIQPHRSLAHDPIFQVVVSCAPVVTFPAWYFESSLIEIHDGQSKFDMSWFFQEAPHELRGTLEYRRDLFATETAARMIKHFQHVLEVIVAEAELRVEQISMLRE